MYYFLDISTTWSIKFLLTELGPPFGSLDYEIRAGLARGLPSCDLD